MTHEWKPGDRFTLELEVTGWSGEWLECKTMSSARRAFPPSDMQYAKLIHSAAPEPRIPEIKVGQKWVTRGGETVTIISDDGTCTYPFRYKTRFGGTRLVTRGGWHSGPERPDDDDLMQIVEAPEPQKLDTSKPMRLLGSDEASFTFLQRATNGMLIIRWDSGSFDVLDESEVENIPEPKRTTTQIVELVPFSDGIRIVEPGDPFKFVGTKSRAKISYTEGEGWSIAEVAL